MPRGRQVLAFGVFGYGAAWAFGAQALYPVALGLIVAAGLAWLTVRLSRGPARLSRTLGAGEHLEGDDVPVELELELASRFRLSSVKVVERVERIGELETALRRRDGRYVGGYVLHRLPRGRYSFAGADAVLEDPLGLERIEVPLPAGPAVLVLPRLVELERLFSERGTGRGEGRGLLLRRPSGFDLHSVREYERGESLRKVHWRSTAHRGQLMVKELEEAHQDEVAVVLDARGSGRVGAALEASFDVQVRAAGSIVRAHVRRGRSALLVVNDAGEESLRVRSERDWQGALDRLAAVVPTGSRSPIALVSGDANAAARALELTLVTADLSPEIADRLLQRALARRAVSVVYVDAASFSAKRRVARRSPQLARLAAAGVPVAVLARGDDLSHALSGTGLTRAAGA